LGLVGCPELIVSNGARFRWIRGRQTVERVPEWKVKGGETRALGGACPATIKTDPRRQLELTPDRVVLRGGLGALRHVV
jgi:hypothetical protein